MSAFSFDYHDIADLDLRFGCTVNSNFSTYGKHISVQETDHQNELPLVHYRQETLGKATDGRLPSASISLMSLGCHFPRKLPAYS